MTVTDGPPAAAADHALCATCGVEYGEGPLRDVGRGCADERRGVPRGGQVWTRVGRLAAEGHAVVLEELEPGLVGLTVEPGVGIGTTGKLVLSEAGNVL